MGTCFVVFIFVLTHGHNTLLAQPESPILIGMHSNLIGVVMAEDVFWLATHGIFQLLNIRLDGYLRLVELGSGRVGWLNGVGLSPRFRFVLLLVVLDIGSQRGSWPAQRTRIHNQ